MKQPLYRFLTLVLPACLIFAAPGQSQSNNAFRTPSGNIACAVYDGYLRCDLRENQAKIPPRPRDCDGDFGNAFQMGLKTYAARICHGDTVFGDYPVLAYGRSWSYQGFVCTSAANGLTCRNPVKHGFFLNKLQQKIF